MTSWTPGAGTNDDFYFDLSTDNFATSLSGYPRFIASTNPEYNLSNLSPGTTYYFRIKGWESGGPNGCYSVDWSSIASFTTSEIPESMTLPFVSSLDNENCYTETIVSDPGTDPQITYTNTTTNIDPIFSPNEGSGMLQFNSYTATNGAELRLELPSINTEGANEIKIRFDWLESNDLSSSNDYVIIQTSLDGGSNWTNNETIFRVGNSDAWVNKIIEISNVNSSNLLVVHLEQTATWIIYLS